MSAGGKQLGKRDGGETAHIRTNMTRPRSRDIEGSYFCKGNGLEAADMKTKKIGRYMTDDEGEMQIPTGTQRWTEGSPHSDKCDDTKRQTTSGMRLQKGDGFKAAHIRTKTTVEANLVATPRGKQNGSRQSTHLAILLGEQEPRSINHSEVMLAKDSTITCW